MNVINGIKNIIKADPVVSGLVAAGAGFIAYQIYINRTDTSEADKARYDYLDRVLDPRGPLVQTFIRLRALQTSEHPPTYNSVRQLFYPLYSTGIKYPADFDDVLGRVKALYQTAVDHREPRSPLAPLRLDPNVLGTLIANIKNETQAAPEQLRKYLIRQDRLASVVGPLRENKGARFKEIINEIEGAGRQFKYTTSVMKQTRKTIAESLSKESKAPLDLLTAQMCQMENGVEAQQHSLQNLKGEAAKKAVQLLDLRKKKLKALAAKLRAYKATPQFPRALFLGKFEDIARQLVDKPRAEWKAIISANLKMEPTIWDEPLNLITTELAKMFQVPALTIIDFPAAIERFNQEVFNSLAFRRTVASFTDVNIKDFFKFFEQKMNRHFDSSAREVLSQLCQIHDERSFAKRVETLRSACSRKSQIRIKEVLRPFAAQEGREISSSRGLGEFKQLAIGNLHLELMRAPTRERLETFFKDYRAVLQRFPHLRPLAPANLNREIANARRLFQRPYERSEAFPDTDEINAITGEIGVFITRWEEERDQLKPTE